ncbi:hypothetical protein AKJ45_03375 [candidate division MSBL1 archaeon SCGC-AAA261F19]|nr:hypothetical protein AKJ45_03375 [candidate division MSBL1 archaeon SCGC-AAA261F19]
MRLSECPREPEAFAEKATEFIKENVDPNEKVICALSGGTDSSVVARLFQEAIQERLYPIHIDTGFMRKIGGNEEPKLVEELFEDLDNFELIDRKEIFFDNVFGVEDAEEKRKKFRSTYVDVLNQKIEEIGASVMAQGTIKPDVLETESEIKSQNNVYTDFKIDKLVEPLAGLYKPEVRKVGKYLGLPESTYLRQPFPGPGLSVRTVGKITKKKLDIEKEANDLVERLIENYFRESYGREYLWDEESGNRIPFQYFASTLDSARRGSTEVNGYLKALGVEAKSWELENRATGVKENGEKRSRVYAHPILLEGDLETELLFYLGEEIPKRFEFSRVLYKLGEWEEGNQIVGIRGVRSNDAITAEPLNIPIDNLREFGWKILDRISVETVAYDLTPKPPGTIEYE